jgi:hypothetical protein
MTLRLSILPLLAIAQPAFAQDAVTLADLQGATMQAVSISQRTLKREGRSFSDRYEADWTVVFTAPDTIQVTFVGISNTPRGVFKTPVESGAARLEKPGPIATRGGGHRVWIFDNGVLTFLRTFEIGGMKSEFSFAKAKTGLSCAAKVEWVREAGMPAVVLKSFVDNVRTEIYDAKQMSSTCQVNETSAQ